MVSRFVCVGLLVLMMIRPCAGQSADDALRRGFANPPGSARPQVWWHWLAGNVSKAGVTADLEAMKRVGLGGGTMANIAFSPEGPAPFLSEAWREVVRHAIREAGRLGLELGFFNCEGWSSSGGPWVTPDIAMQMVVWSEARVSGGATGGIRLPQPLTRLGTYHDIATLAFPTPPSEADRPVHDLKPSMVATGGVAVDGALLTDGDPATYVTLPEGPERRGYLQVEFAQPVSVTGIRLTPGPEWTRDGVELQCSDDGAAWRAVGRITMPLAFMETGTDWQAKLDFAKQTARFFRVTFVGGRSTWTGPVPTRMTVAELEFVPADRPEAAIAPETIIDLSARLDASGRLDWTPPAGEWTVVRFGYTPIGKHNHPVTKYGDGLEIDKLSRKALEAHFSAFVDKVIADAGPLAGKTLAYSLIDSYECGEQNWTPRMPQEFAKARGYDLTRWLPALTGRVVGDVERSARFLEDFRGTIADLWNANYYGAFAELLHRRGLKSSVEAYGNGTFSDLRASGLNDMPMSEFWFGNNGDGGLAKMAASAANVYGRPIVGAESFTSGPEYNFDPASMKIQGDWEYVQGVNRYYFHSYAQQMWTDDRKPGWVWGNGIHLTRNLTWFDAGKSWFAYLARCQFLLQSGRSVSDILAYQGETHLHYGEGGGLRAAPPGYDFDALDRDALLHGVRVQGGRLLAPSGKSYRLLTLPPDDAVSPAVLRRVRDLVRAGAVVFGPRPRRALGLSNAPASDADVRRLAAELWGSIDGATVTEHAVGRGRVIWTGAPDRLQPALDRLKIAPDFTCSDKDARLLYLHRRKGDADWYFLSNQETYRLTVDCTFRVRGRTPEVWDAETGRTFDAPVWRSEPNGRTAVQMAFEPGQSLFVVFAKPASFAAHVTSVRRIDRAGAPREKHVLVVTKAIYVAQDGAGYPMDLTDRVAALVRNGTLVVMATNAFAGADPAGLHVKELRIEYTYDGKPARAVVPENGMLRLPPVRPEDDRPAFEALPSAGGRLALRVWEPGVYVVRRSSGKAARLEIAEGARSEPIAGPWTLHFSPRWGGPETIVFDQLVDWTRRPEEGVKYYSGTATYVKAFELPRGLAAPGRAVFLDLGALKNLAEVTLNGRNLGVLWRPPWRVEVTGALRAGRNELRIAVTNLWANRLIGDTRLPADKRIATTTTNPYNPGSPLQESGLLGPVRIVSVPVVDVR